MRELGRAWLTFPRRRSEPSRSACRRRAGLGFARSIGAHSTLTRRDRPSPSGPARIIAGLLREDLHIPDRDWIVLRMLDWQSRGCEQSSRRRCHSRGAGQARADAPLIAATRYIGKCQALLLASIILACLYSLRVDARAQEILASRALRYSFWGSASCLRSGQARAAPLASNRREAVTVSRARPSMAELQSREGVIPPYGGTVQLLFPTMCEVADRGCVDRVVS